MRRWLYLTFFFLLITIFFIGCSGDGAQLTSPGDSTQCIDPDNANRDGLAGCWQVVINEGTGEVLVLPMRVAQRSLNPLGMLQTATPIGLEINPNSVTVYPSEHRVSLEVRLRHPMPSLGGMFTAFDVRGIVFGPEVVNADGFTAHMNPNDFTGVPFGYTDGLLGTPDWLADYHAPYAGYKYFCDGLGPNDDLPAFMRSSVGQANRGRFVEGEQYRRRYVLDWDESDHGFLIFNYAVVASYALPKAGASAPFGVDDFGIGTANCAESFCFEGEISMNTVCYWNSIGGGAFATAIEIWDWQGLDDSQLRLEPVDGVSFEPLTTTEYIPGTTPYSGIYVFNYIPVLPLSGDNIPLVITVTDQSETFASAWYGGLLPQTNWRYDDYVYTVYEMTLPVDNEPPCLPVFLNETFDNPVGWNTGPGSFWNFNTYTQSAADNRSVAVCYGNPEGVTITWCESPWMYIKPDCYDLPFRMFITHQVDMETFYDRCWVELKRNCEEWKKIYPDCGWFYGLGDWWDGYHELDGSRFTLDGLVEGDYIRIRFVTHTLDGNANCVQDGYHGWQIFDTLITDDY